MKSAQDIRSAIPGSALSVTALFICLKCAFDLFTRQLGLAPRTAYIELRKHVPEQADFTGAATTRPHFPAESDVRRCPYCNAARTWFARFDLYRIEGHPSIEKARKKLWTALRKSPDRFALWTPTLTKMQIFSDWLERLNRALDFQSDTWLIDVAVEHLKRSAPSVNWDEELPGRPRRVRHSRRIEKDWVVDGDRLLISNVLYGDILLVQHLLSRSHLHGGLTFEGRLTLHELVGRLRRIGYLSAREIESDEPFQTFENAVSSVVDSGPDAVYYAVDRREYLDKLKTVYEKRQKTK